ncbi:MAG: class I SAM-dependent methyltransferase [Gemmatimonadetes bacterium]|nr:class I SAM-dependent methyltransferase [Gemmatimonadota bacterium]
MLRYAAHPYFPVRLGFRKVLGVVNPGLEKLLGKTDPFTLVPPRNRVTLYREAAGVLQRGVPGDFVEIGVHRGGTAAVTGALLKDEPGRTLHLFDRWGDLPDPTPEDGARAEEYRRDRIPGKLRELVERPPLEDARRVVEEVVGLDRGRVRYYQGWYNETLPAAVSEYPGTPIAFASIDCDYHDSLVLALDFLERHVSPGAVAVVDDYGTWPGARTATDRFVAERPGRVKMRVLPIGQAVLEFAGGRA